jgi:hypothetical protein
MAHDDDSNRTTRKAQLGSSFLPRSANFLKAMDPNTAPALRLGRGNYLRCWTRNRHSCTVASLVRGLWELPASTIIGTVSPIAPFP